MCQVFFKLYRSFWFFVFSFVAFSIIISSFCHAETVDKRACKLRFSLIGTYYSENPLFQFSVITPDFIVRTKTINRDTIIGHVESRIRVQKVSSGNYILIIKNISNTPLSLIGGLIASKSNSGIQKSHAINLNLAIGQEASFLYSLEQGFYLPPVTNEALLKWDPFDWLGL